MAAKKKVQHKQQTTKGRRVPRTARGSPREDRKEKRTLKSTNHELRLQLDQLTAFHWAATLGSFGKAAKRIKISQQAISNRIEKLEEAVGAALFERSSGKPGALTYTGQRVLPAFGQLALLHSQTNGAGTSDETLAQPLRLGVMEAFVHSYLPGLLAQLRAAFPKLRLQLVVLASSMLGDMIQSDELDLTITAISASDGIAVESELMRAMRMVFVGAPRRSARKEHDIADLVEAGVICFQPKTPIHRRCLEVIHAATDNFALHTVSSITAMTALLRAGYGVATMPEPVAKLLTQRFPELVILESQPALPELPVCLNWRKDAAYPDAEKVLEKVAAFTKQALSSQGL